MAIQAFIHDCACRMLGVKEIPLDLRNFLDDIEMYTNLREGSVASRQVVAVALASYTRIKRLEKDIDKVDWNGLRERDE
jgi:hypothetical protein